MSLTFGDTLSELAQHLGAWMASHACHSYWTVSLGHFAFSLFWCWWQKHSTTEHQPFLHFMQLSTHQDTSEILPNQRYVCVCVHMCMTVI